MPRSGRQVAFAAVILVVVAVAAVALWVVGSPGQERLRRLDDRRVTDLESIAAAVDGYWAAHRQLPASLDELADGNRLFATVSDPVSARSYEYRVIGDRRYELCAEFQAASRDNDARGSRLSGPREFWRHGSGRQCFEVEARARVN